MSDSDIHDTASAIMMAVATEMSDMIKEGRHPPPDGLFVPALALGLQRERDRCARHALSGASGTQIAHLIRSGAP